jgi:hypothetical protein
LLHFLTPLYFKLLVETRVELRVTAAAEQDAFLGFRNELIPFPQQANAADLKALLGGRHGGR